MQSTNLPTEIKIIDITYKVEYCDKPSEVDVFKRSSLWGQIDYWTRTIRIYKGADSNAEAVSHVIWHEIVHGIIDRLHIDQIDKHADMEKIVDLLSTGINSVLLQNPGVF